MLSYPKSNSLGVIHTSAKSTHFSEWQKCVLVLSPRLADLGGMIPPPSMGITFNLLAGIGVGASTPTQSTCIRVLSLSSGPFRPKQEASGST